VPLPLNISPLSPSLYHASTSQYLSLSLWTSTHSLSPPMSPLSLPIYFLPLSTYLSLPISCLSLSPIIPLSPYLSRHLSHSLSHYLSPLSPLSLPIYLLSISLYLAISPYLSISCLSPPIIPISPYLSPLSFPLPYQRRK